MKNRTIIGIVCMILAVAMTFAVAPLLNRLTSDTTTVVRLKQEVGRGAKITAEQVETVKVKTDTKEELETALSIITTSYVRSDDIVAAVRENIKYIKPPLRDVFKSFEGEATAISSNIKRALYKLKSMVDNEIFWEWCDTLIQCQDDRTLKDTLLPIVGKLTDVRIVNSELKTMLSSARNEYWFMVALVVGNIPLLYLLNKDWFHTLLFTTPGKLVCGVCGMVILITALFMMKYTKPIEYKR